MDVLYIFANDLAITGAAILIKKLDTLSGPKERFGFRALIAFRTEISVMILNLNWELT